MPENDDKNRWFFSGIWNEISGFFEMMFDKTWNTFGRIAFGLVSDINKAVLEWAQGLEDKLWGDYLDIAEKRGWIDEDNREQLESYKGAPFPINMAIFFVVPIFFFINSAKMIIDNISGEMRRNYNVKYRARDVYHTEAAAASLLAPERAEQIEKVLRELGLPDEQIELLFISLRRPLDEDTIRQLYLRGEINETELRARMKELGYTPERIEEYKKPWEIIPPPADLVSFATRYAWNPEMRAKWPWAYEAPAEFRKWAGKQGISEQWAEFYWYIHWTQPGLRDVFEMMHRYDPENPEQKISSAEDVDFSLWATGFSEYWIKRLKKISYMPFTRVDVRRMHRIGVLSGEELIRAYEEVGFNREKAETMAEFTIQYNRQAEKNLTRSQITNGYKEDLLQRIEAKNLLLDMGYSLDEAEYLLEREDYEKDKEIQQLQLDNIKHRFQNNLIGQFEVRDQLGKLNLDGERIKVLIDKWLIDKYEAMRLPTKTDLEKFLENGIIDLAVYTEEMMRLGYSEKYVKWYYALLQK